MFNFFVNNFFCSRWFWKKILYTYLQPISLQVCKFWDRLFNYVGQHGLASLKQWDRSRIGWYSYIAVILLLLYIYSKSNLWNRKINMFPTSKRKQNWNIFIRSKTRTVLVKATLQIDALKKLIRLARWFTHYVIRCERVNKHYGHWYL